MSMSPLSNFDAVWAGRLDGRPLRLAQAPVDNQVLQVVGGAVDRQPHDQGGRRLRPGAGAVELQLLQRQGVAAAGSRPSVMMVAMPSSPRNLLKLRSSLFRLSAAPSTASHSASAAAAFGPAVLR